MKGEFKKRGRKITIHPASQRDSTISGQIHTDKKGVTQKAIKILEFSE